MSASPDILRGPGRVVCPGVRSGSRRAWTSGQETERVYSLNPGPQSTYGRGVPELILVLGSQLGINPAIGCHYFLPGPRLTPQPPSITARNILTMPEGVSCISGNIQSSVNYFNH